MAPYDHDERLRRILAFVRERLHFLPDPHGNELIGAADFHLGNISTDGLSQGDCDDAAVLAGTLALAVGRPVRIAVASFRPDRRFHHTWAEARGRSHWHELDPFRAERFTGRPTRIRYVKV